MATSSRLASASWGMIKKYWRSFPHDLFVNVAAFLPCASLMKFRTVSERWNALPLDPQFQELRPSFCREVLEHARQCPAVLGYVTTHCTDGVLLLEKKPDPASDSDMYVLRLSDISLKRVSPNTNPSVIVGASGAVTRFVVLHVVVHQVTKNYTIFAIQFKDAYYRDPSGSDLQTAYRYDSATGRWSSCGTCPYFIKLKDRFSHHQGDHLLSFKLDDCADRGRGWRCYWPGNLRLAIAEISLPFQSRMRETLLLFPHRGRLLLSAMHTDASGCCIWESQGEMVWTMIDGFRFSRCSDSDPSTYIAIHQPQHSQRTHCGSGRCVSVCAFGNFLCFQCKGLKYDLDTGKLKSMCQGEGEMMRRRFPSVFPLCFRSKALRASGSRKELDKQLLRIF